MPVRVLILAAGLVADLPAAAATARPEPARMRDTTAVEVAPDAVAGEAQPS